MYVYAKKLKSKDIDIIVEYEELEKLRSHHGWVKNDRLKKYEIHIEGIDIDIYVPFFSNLGIPVEAMKELSIVREGFTVATKEALLILKQKAWLDRGHSLKGEKDKLDILALIETGISWKEYKKILTRYGVIDYAGSLISLLHSMTEAPELDLNAHRYSRLKKATLAEL